MRRSPAAGVTTVRGTTPTSWWSTVTDPAIGWRSVGCAGDSGVRPLGTLTAREPAGSTAVARVAVEVVIKPEILDPQGKAILAALARTGQPGVSSVRQGKHFDLEVDDSVSDADLEEIAGTLLANPVIETWTVTRMAPETVRSVDTAGTFDTAGTVRDTR